MRGQGGVAASGQGRGGSREVTFGNDAQAAPCGQTASQLGAAGAGVVGTTAMSILGLGIHQVDVATGEA